MEEFYDLLFSEYGDAGWWPGETEDEIIIGAVLTQNTSWKNVEISIAKLKREGLLSLRDISVAEIWRIRELVKSSGFFNQKSERIKALANSILQEYGGVAGMKKQGVDDLTRFLSPLKGIGQETMDCILLYALDKPVFVVDKYTFRIFGRIGISDADTLKKIKEIVDRGLGEDLFRKKNLHGMIVYLAKDYCRSKPLCERCPLVKRCDFGLSETTSDGKDVSVSD